MNEIRNDWTREEVEAIYWRPLMELIYQGARIHRQHHDALKIQTCSLLSVKTGGCSEDCKYCSQSSRYQTGVEAEQIAPLEEVVRAAKTAKAKGASRFCMGAAWKKVRNSGQFEQILEMVRAVDQMGLQVCCTLGMITPEQAKRLKEAGLYAYNHNLDTSEKFYPEVITTRSKATGWKLSRTSAVRA
jgi:biotin synthase